MALIMNLSLVTAVINILLIASLLYVYGRNFIKMKSHFAAGLFIFAALFLLHNVLYLYFAITMMPYYAGSAQLYGFIFNLLQVLAFLILNIITWK